MRWTPKRLGDLLYLREKHSVAELADLVGVTEKHMYALLRRAYESAHYVPVKIAEDMELSPEELEAAIEHELRHA